MCLCVSVCVHVCVLERRCRYLKSVFGGDQGKRYSAIAEVLSGGDAQVVPLNQSNDGTFLFHTI